MTATIRPFGSGLELRRLGRTEMQVTCLSLGCASMGDPRHTDRTAIDAIHRAIELGINFLDTSPHYAESVGWG